MSDERLPTAARPIGWWSRVTPRAIAVMEGDGSWSYARLAGDIARAAHVLADAGLDQGMLVGIQTESRYRHLVLLLACEVLGAAHTAMVEYDLTVDTELASRCDLLCVETVHPGVLTHRRMVRLSTDFMREMARVPEDPTLLDRVWPAGDLVRVGRTSGTTGRHKYVGYSRLSMRENVDIIPYMVNFDRTRRGFVSLYRFIHIGTYTDSMSAFRCGATVIYSAGDQMAANVRKLRNCHAYLLVRDASYVIESGQFRAARADTCSLCVAGGFVPPALRQALRDTVTTDWRMAYSMNETRFIMTARDDGPGTVLPDTSVRIVTESGGDAKPGEPGRIWARTPRMASGYLWDDAQTKAHFVDGWFITNDIGVMPEGGGLIVMGRADEMINLGGIKVAPHPIETRIRAMGGVTDAVLIALDNNAGTGSLHVFVERGDPAIDAAVRSLVTPLVADHAPTYALHYQRALPRTDNGKVKRNELRASLIREAAAAS